MHRFQLYQNIVENFLICKSKEEKQKFFARISFEDFIEIHSLWNYKGDLDLEIKKHDFMPEKISYKNLQTLAQKTWLNDEVKKIYFFLNFLIYLGDKQLC